MLNGDKHLECWIAGHRVGALDWLFEGLSWIGRLGLVWVAIALALALLWRRPSILVLVVAADLVADLSAAALKALVPRHRPRVETLVPRLHDHSFPSGHAATSFACVAVLAWFAPRFRAPLYALAVLIAFSRLYVGVHFPLDVLAGAVLGTLVGAPTVLLQRAASRRGSRRRLRSG
jgi:undecaprenyl-diphosphatase